MVISVQVEDPSKYGVVVTDEDHRVERFVEKPKVRIVATSLPRHLQDMRHGCASGSL